MKKKYLIIAPTPWELQPILDVFKPYMSLKKHPFTIHMCRDEQVEVNIYASGMGIASTAFAVGYAMQNFHVSELILLGFGGVTKNRKNLLGKMTIATSDRYLKFGAKTPTGFDDLSIKYDLLSDHDNKPPFCFHSHAWMKELYEQLHYGTCDELSSSNSDISFLNDIYPQITVENMEGAACAQIANLYNIPCIQARAITNVIANRDTNSWLMDEAKIEIAKFSEKLLSHWKTIK
jgi:nucleoside phosphorylase